LIGGSFRAPLQDKKIISTSVSGEYNTIFQCPKNLEQSFGTNVPNAVKCSSSPVITKVRATSFIQCREGSEIAGDYDLDNYPPGKDAPKNTKSEETSTLN
jgi:hypothetical protein